MKSSSTCHPRLLNFDVVHGQLACQAVSTDHVEWCWMNILVLFDHAYVEFCSSLKEQLARILNFSSPIHPSTLRPVRPSICLRIRPFMRPMTHLSISSFAFLLLFVLSSQFLVHC